MAEETVFFEQGDVKVTNSRFMTYGTTHSMSGVTSVTQVVYKPNRKGPIIVAVVGLLCFIFSWWVAIIVLAAAVVWWFLQKTKYGVLMSSASGDQDALSSTDADFINTVVAALNDAIVHRG